MISASRLITGGRKSYMELPRHSRNSPALQRWWEKFIATFLPLGLADASSRHKGGPVGMKEEGRRCMNILQLAIELHNALECPGPYALIPDKTCLEALCQYQNASGFLTPWNDIFMEKMDLSSINLERSLLLCACLTGTNLNGANLIYADLTGAVLMKANLSDAMLLEANLGSADLTDANLICNDLCQEEIYPHSRDHHRYVVVRKVS